MDLTFKVVAGKKRGHVYHVRGGRGVDFIADSDDECR